MAEILSSAWSYLIVIFAFSILIFIHELGHYCAALLVGVRPERFFVGFDIYGLCISKEYKGCVYGIGLLPLGGYCKLTGQSDDPREQKHNASKGYKNYDYNAKPLWARALIISAGVIMNLIFGFILLMYGFMQGVPTSPSVAGIVVENTPAANADIKSGDIILAINGEKMPNFGKVKETLVMNPGETFDLTLERNGKNIHRRVMGNQGPEGLNQIGLMPAFSTTISGVNTELPFEKKYFTDTIQENDIITSINGEPINSEITEGYKVLDAVNSNVGKNIDLTIRRNDKELNLSLPVLGAGSYDIGYRVAIGVNGVIENSPAERAGLEAGDSIISIEVDGKDVPLINASSFIKAVTSQAFLPVKVEYLRDGKSLTSTIKPVFMGWNEEISQNEDSLLGVGVDGNIVTKILVEDSPLKSGDKITAINGKILDKNKEIREQVALACTAPVIINTTRQQGISITPAISLDTATAQIGISMEPLPKVLKVIKGSEASKFLTPGSAVNMILLSPDLESTAVTWFDRNSKEQKPHIFKTPKEMLNNPQTADISGYLPFGLNMSKVIHPVDSYYEAAVLATDKTIDMSLTIYKLLHKLIVNDISTQAISGPIGILRIMKNTAEGSDGFMRIISLLALLSINLAVVNLLPFPVLDGGHLVFIIYEWITRRPPSEKFRIAAQYFGAICLFSLMIYVTLNDVIKWVSGS